MESQEIRKRFLDFFRERGHAVVPSSSLIPDDPSVLLTTAGMQQFKPYLTGKADPVEHFGNKNVFSIQKSFRTTDIDEVGDNSHLTFFEMMGNFSFGGYFKERAIALSFEFITSPESLGLNPQKLYVTAFKGDSEVPQDDDAIRLWQEQFKSVGIDAKIGERIFLYGREKNWWEAGPGPAGPDAEMFYDLDTPHDTKFGPACHPNCDCGRFVEIGNDVFVQYNKTAEGKYEPLEQKAVDNGRGFERLVMVMQGKKNIFETDLFAPLVALIPENVPVREQRIIVDHLRGSVFLISDGVRPSNKEAGYILRRLMRRVFAYQELHKILPHVFEALLHDIVHDYSKFYGELMKTHDVVREEFKTEQEKFDKALRRGLIEIGHKIHFDQTLPRTSPEHSRHLAGFSAGMLAFDLAQSRGFPVEISRELFEKADYDLSGFDRGFGEKFQKHQEISRAGREKKFGGHGLILDTGELKAASEEELKIVTRLHTATHLLNAALRNILGPDIRQDGSDITAERTRFDFTFPRKVTVEELRRIEEWVNDAVGRDLPVAVEEMLYAEAVKTGARSFFREKYPARVKVYTVADPASGEVVSRELCGGPHVSRTGEIGRFKILKEESSSAGVRRIRAMVEKTETGK